MGKLIWTENPKKECFAFTPDEVDALRECLRGAADPDNFIAELAHDCNRCGPPPPDRAERKKRLRRLLAEVSRFAGMDVKPNAKKTALPIIREIQEFAYDNFQVEGRSNEIARLANKIHSDMLRLESLLETKSMFFNPPAGRKHSERAVELAQAVKFTFERLAMPVSTDRAGQYFEALRICLEAIAPLCPDGASLPTIDPSRLIKFVLDETRLK